MLDMSISEMFLTSSLPPASQLQTQFKLNYSDLNILEEKKLQNIDTFCKSDHDLAIADDRANHMFVFTKVRRI